MNNTNNSSNYLIMISFLRSLSLIFPLVMVDLSYGLPFPIILLAALPFLPLLIPSLKFAMFFEFLYNIALRPATYVWGIIVTVRGKQDFFAIAFYVLTFLQLKSIISNSLIHFAVVINGKK